jgi:CHAT domain
MREEAPSGNGRRRIAVLDISVDGNAINWFVAGPDSGPGEIQLRDKVALNLSPRRKATITLLANLLRHHIDQEHEDLLGRAAYKDLLEVVGHELFELLFVGKIAEEVERHLRLLKEEKINLLRIKLWFAGEYEEWLATLPWEYARTPPGHSSNRRGVFLSQTTELVLSRRLQVDDPRSLGKERWPVPVLLVVSSPRGLGAVDATPVVQKLEELEAKELITLARIVEEPPSVPEPYAYRATRENFMRTVRALNPVIVHFIGHGRAFKDEGQLAFAHADGAQDWVSDEGVDKSVRACKRLKLVVLQACESALPDPYVGFSGVARRLAASGVPAVVAMQYSVRSATANAFSRAFYEALIPGSEPIDVAVDLGRREIELDDEAHEAGAFGLPVVYLRGDQSLGDPDAPRPGSHDVTAINRRDLTAAPAICPNCQKPLADADIYCPGCSLPLRCVCGARYRDPMQDSFCARCRRPNQQEPYQPDTVTVATGGQEVAKQTLSVFPGGGGGR